MEIEKTVSQLSQYVTNGKKVQKVTEDRRVWYFSKFIIPVILLNAVKDTPEKWGCCWERDAVPKSNRQWAISKLSINAITYSLHILIDIAISVKYCPATPKPFIQGSFYSYLNIFECFSAKVEHDTRHCYLPRFYWDIAVPGLINLDFKTFYNSVILNSTYKASSQWNAQLIWTMCGRKLIWKDKGNYGFTTGEVKLYNGDGMNKSINQDLDSECLDCIGSDKKTRKQKLKCF